MLNLREAEREFGLHEYRIYQAVRDGQLHAIQLGGKGRIYYPEWELRALAVRLGILPDPSGGRGGNANEDWQHNLPGAA